MYKTLKEMKTAEEILNATTLRRTELITESGYEEIHMAINAAREECLREATERVIDEKYTGIAYYSAKNIIESLIKELK